MAVNVLDSKRIQITDWRPGSDTEYSHSGKFAVSGESMELTGYELGNHQIISLDGRTYKAMHSPTVVASVSPTTTYPLTESGKYFSTPHNNAFKIPRTLSIVLRFKLISALGTSVLIGKGADWELRLDSSNRLCFYDGSNGLVTSTLTVPVGLWSIAGFRMSDNAPTGTTSTLLFVVNGSENTQTVNPVVARPMGTDGIYVGASYSTPASNYVSAYWDRVCVWDESLHDNALDNAMNYLKIQERGLILDCEFPYVSSATITDDATAYEVEM